MGARPYVLVSVAMSADGYIDDGAAGGLVLSGPEDLDLVDAERAGCDAIMVGAQTIRSDDPRLLVRSAQRRGERQARGRPANPVKVTVTASGNLDPGAQFFAADGAGKLVYSARAAAASLGRRLAGRAEVIGLPGGSADSAGAACQDGKDLAWVLSDLAGRGIARLMIEGGARLLGQVLAHGLADELRLAVAPVFVADPAAPRLLAGWGKCRDVPGDERPDLLRRRMALAGMVQAGDVAVLRYLPSGRRPEGLAGSQPG